jgi:ATP-dependent DNA helicase RecG
MNPAAYMSSHPELLSLTDRISIGIDAGESQFREFKSAWSREPGAPPVPRDVKEICRNVGEVLVAFANADGGELIVGVEDDSTITGIPHKSELIEQIKRAPHIYVHKDTPLPSPIVREVELDGGKVLYFSVTSSFDQVHITSDGRCLKRFDRENRPAAAEHIQADRRETASREYDRAYIDGSSIGDLDLELINATAQQIAPGYSPEKVLQYLGLADFGPSGLRFRRAALLLFARDIVRWHPRCSVRVMRIKGIERGAGDNYNVSQDEQIIGNILQLFDDAWETLRPFLARTRYQSSGLFRESLIYPEAACREALVNAIAHRDYSREGSPIEVFVFDDRMEFRSPGGLLSSITVKDLASLSGAHESRNVMVARVLREVGYMREMGEGIPRIFQAMRESELVDPELRNEREGFTVTLRHRSIFTRQDVEWLDGYREFDLTKNEQRVVLLGRDGHLLSTKEIIEVAGIVDTDDFRALYEGLRQKGVIYSAKPRGTSGGRKRETGRFQVRPPREVEQFLGELLDAVRIIAPATALPPAATRAIKQRLSPTSPYAERPDWSLQALGFIDSQRRFLPKAMSYVPELEDKQGIASPRMNGVVTSVKPGGYGFIQSDSDGMLFFHYSALMPPLERSSMRSGMRVSFAVKPAASPDQRDVAVDIRADG